MAIGTTAALLGSAAIGAGKLNVEQPNKASQGVENWTLHRQLGSPLNAEKQKRTYRLDGLS
jgi:hypothetical protein